MKKLKFVIMVLFLLVFPLSGCSQPSEEGTLEYVVSNVEQFSPETLTAVMELSAQSGDTAIEEEHHYWYSQGRWRIEREDDAQIRQTNIYDGTDSWSYTDEDMESSIIVIREPSGADIFDFKNFGGPYTLSYEGTEKVEGHLAHVIKGAMEDEHPQSFRVTWWIDAETWFPFMSESKNEISRTKVIFRDIRINEDVDESLFEFTPPADAEVMELNPDDYEDSL